MSIKHTKLIYEYPDVCSLNQCQEILSLIKSSKKYEDCMQESHPRTKIRNNSAFNISFHAMFDESLKKADDFIHQIFSKIHLDYITNNPNYFILKGAEHLYNLSCSYTYREYTKNDYYDWHIDSSPTSQLVFSYILYLNEDFIGGDTLFLHQRIKVKPKIGSMLCFPCDLGMVHKSSKIQEGEKNIIWTCMEHKLTH